MSALARMAVGIALGIAGPAFAVTTPVAVTSYSMPNGGSSGGVDPWFYWDLAYNGSGSTTTDGAALSGGTGDLTDGIVPDTTYETLEGPSGAGPYVGWRSNVTPNPTIIFNFAGEPGISSMRIHVDNSGIGGVGAPGAILINGINTAFTAPDLGTAGWVEFAGLDATGNSLTLQMNHSSYQWLFISEVAFASNVPEPAHWALMIAGFGLVGATLRRRRMVVA